MRKRTDHRLDALDHRLKSRLLVSPVRPTETPTDEARLRRISEILAILIDCGATHAVTRDDPELTELVNALADLSTGHAGDARADCIYDLLWQLEAVSPSTFTDIYQGLLERKDTNERNDNDNR